jgi:hypothetical protein
LTHTGLFKALSKLWVLSLIPQTRPTVSLALFNVRVAGFVGLEELRDFRGVLLGHGNSAKG